MISELFDQIYEYEERETEDGELLGEYTLNNDCYAFIVSINSSFSEDGHKCYPLHPDTLECIESDDEDLCPIVEIKTIDDNETTYTIKVNEAKVFILYEDMKGYIPNQSCFDSLVYFMSEKLKFAEAMGLLDFDDVDNFMIDNVPCLPTTEPDETLYHFDSDQMNQVNSFTISKPFAVKIASGIISGEIQIE